MATQGAVVMPTFSPNSVIKAQTATFDPLVYHNGPLISNGSIFLVFWGNWNNDPAGVKNTLTAFLSSVGSTNVFSVLPQYSETGYSIPGTIGIPSGTYHNEFILTDPSTLPASVANPGNGNFPSTSAALATEAINERAEFAKEFMAGRSLGTIPLIVIATPNGTQPGGYCAFHGYATKNGVTTAYAFIPYLAGVGGCGAGTFGPASDNDGVTMATLHEIAEAFTDPVTPLVNGNYTPTGWAGGGSVGSVSDEIGDKCAYHDMYELNGYPVQPLWSNATNACSPAFNASSYTITANESLITLPQNSNDSSLVLKCTGPGTGPSGQCYGVTPTNSTTTAGLVGVGGWWQPVIYSYGAIGTTVVTFNLHGATVNVRVRVCSASTC